MSATMRETQKQAGGVTISEINGIVCVASAIISLSTVAALCGVPVMLNGSFSLCSSSVLVMPPVLYFYIGITLIGTSLPLH